MKINKQLLLAAAMICFGAMGLLTGGVADNRTHSHSRSSRPVSAIATAYLLFLALRR